MSANKIHQIPSRAAAVPFFPVTAIKIRCDWKWREETHGNNGKPFQCYSMSHRVCQCCLSTVGFSSYWHLYFILMLKFASESNVLGVTAMNDLSGLFVTFTIRVANISIGRQSLGTPLLLSEDVLRMPTNKATKLCLVFSIMASVGATALQKNGTTSMACHRTVNMV
jgi:hypothetical protein